MPRSSSPQRTFATTLAVCAFLVLAHTAHAQDFCPGDVDHNGVVTPADVDALLPVLFIDPLLLDVDTLLRADVNDDGVLNGADIAAILALDGVPCPSPRPTPTRTPTPTMTPILTATQTSTRPPTPTETPVCVVQQASLGSTNGTLSPTDCERTFLGQPHFVDVYNISAAPGSAIKVELATTAPLVGYLAVNDPGGQFDSVVGSSPIQFTVTSGKPYQILVTSDPSSVERLGDYTLTLTSTSCPTPVALPIGTSRPFNLDGSECPEPGDPTFGTKSGTNQDPADVYTFMVTDVPKNISITMQQLSLNDSISPAMALLGPDGYELATQDNNFDCTAPTGQLLCSQIRFLALQRGTYTILAAGTGGTGRYSMTLTSPTCTPRVLNNIPADHALSCTGTGLGCMSTLDGNTTHTPCAAPLPDPGSTDLLPEPGSPAELYSFTAIAGDVISVRMTSDDVPHLYLLGPAPSSKVIASDNTSGGAQFAATLAVSGTYTIVAANDSALLSDDPPINYTLLVQKCPVRGGLNPLTGRKVSATYTPLDCFGSQDIPYQSYAFAGLAGQFVTTTMTSSTVDSFVRVIAPDGSIVKNDDDAFRSAPGDARASRVLPIDGTYFVEASTSPSGAPVDTGARPPPSFTLQARVCGTTAAVPGDLSGTWEDTDCDLGGGTKGDVFTFPAGSGPSVVTLLPPANGCVLALLGDGTQVPSGGCATRPIDIPILGSSAYGFIVAGVDTSTRGPYTVGLSSCPASAISFGDTRHGVLDGSNCADPNGIRADWFLLQGPAGLVNFNSGMTGKISAGFPLGALLSDSDGGSPILGAFGVFNEDPSSMFSTGNNLAAVLRVTGQAPTDRGAYDLSIETASLRQ